MADTAFKTAAYPAYTTAELIASVESGNTDADTVAKMRAEIIRRDRVAAGDVSAMTPGERLRHART